MPKLCVMCGNPLPPSHKHDTCSMCYGDLDYGTDGSYQAYLQRWAEEEAFRSAQEAAEGG